MTECQLVELQINHASISFNKNLTIIMPAYFGILHVLCNYYKRQKELKNNTADWIECSKYAVVLHEPNATSWFNAYQLAIIIIVSICKQLDLFQLTDRKSGFSFAANGIN